MYSLKYHLRNKQIDAENRAKPYVRAGYDPRTLEQILEEWRVKWETRKQKEKEQKAS